MDATQDKDQAITDFWSDVERLLRNPHGHDDQAVKRGIHKYRGATDKHNQSGTVYNQGEDQTASGIDGLIKHNYQIPKPT